MAVTCSSYRIIFLERDVFLVDVEIRGYFQFISALNQERGGVGGTNNQRNEQRKVAPVSSSVTLKLR